jgi:predicted signal transduction protein with EAL and GGDEF domain
MISFTFAVAFGVRVIGAVFLTSGVPVVGVVVVAMISP